MRLKCQDAKTEGPWEDFMVSLYDAGPDGPRSGSPCTCPLPEAGIVTDEGVRGPLFSGGLWSPALDSGLTAVSF